jgi:hypothetical protein
MDNQYQDGQIVGSDTVRVLPQDAQASVVINTWLWVDGAWSTRPEKPGTHYMFEGGSWVFDSEGFWRAVRLERDIKMAGCDWTQIPDNQLTETQKAEWRTYRQALRDLPATNATVTSVQDLVWPTEPGS